jgi:uncharacterized protein
MTRLLDQWNETHLEKALATGRIDVHDAQGVTPLWCAVYFGQRDWVARLLDAGARVDGHDGARIDRAGGDGHVVSIWHGSIPDPGYPAEVGSSTLLHAAVARAGSPEVVRLLLDRGLAIDAHDRYGDTPLHVASFKKRADLVHLLITAGASVNAIDRAGYAPIDHGWSDLDVVRALLDNGADPNGGPRVPWQGSSYEWSVVSHAAAWDRCDVLHALLSAGADPKRHPEALPLAAKAGKAGSVKVLLDHGAPLDATTNWRGKDRRPLASAAMYASKACAELLLPACEDQLDEALATAVELASEDLYESSNERAPQRRRLVAWLLDRGADPNAAIVDAAAAEDESYAKLLLERGARVDVVDAEGDCPLVRAARHGRYRVARLLLEKGADPKVRDALGNTAFSVAERAYRDDNVHDARLVKSAIADAGGGPPPAKTEPAAPTGPTVGTRVTHAKFGAGTIVAAEGDKLVIRFDSGEERKLLAKFVTMA